MAAAADGGSGSTARSRALLRNRQSAGRLRPKATGCWLLPAFDRAGPAATRCSSEAGDTAGAIGRSARVSRESLEDAAPPELIADQSRVGTAARLTIQSLYATTPAATMTNAISDGPVCVTSESARTQMDIVTNS